MVTPRDARKSEIPQFKVSAESRWSTLRENLAILLAPVHLATNAGASQPFEIENLWRRPEELGRAQWLSLAAHGLLILVLAMPLAHKLTQTRTGTTGRDDWEHLVFPGLPLKAVKTPGEGIRGGGSGGARQPDSATVGRLARFALIQIAPPSLRPNPNPRLAVEAKLVGPPELQVPNLPYPKYGDPNAPKLTNSAGPGFGDGFGEKGPGGVGPRGRARGYGPDDEGVGDAARPGITPGVTYPECSYCPLPGYSDDARKAKLQGQVEIRLVVTADGRATNLQVVRGLGLGLDERAMEAVRKWHFRPSRDAAGRPTAAWVTVEVTFRLL